jgi:hypothetical protein
MPYPAGIVLSEDSGLIGPSASRQGPSQADALFIDAAGMAHISTLGGLTMDTGLVYELAQDAVTARAGGGQALATQLTAQTTRVTVCATAGDSVKLPTSLAGLELTIINAGVAPMAVFPATGDTINGLAANASVTMPPKSVDIFVCPLAGAWHAEVGVGYSGTLFTEYAQDAITAFAGGGQGSATQLVAQTNRITTVATTGDSVKLPASAAGLELMVINSGANPMAVFPATGDTIDGLAANASVSQMQNSLVIYTCAAAGAWFSEGLATGFGGPGLATQSTTNGITAFAGGGQASAVLLTSMVNRVTTVATAADSVKLPVSAVGMSITIINAAAANSMNLFPNTGESINALAANAAFAVAAGKTVTAYCANAGQWHTVLSA